MLTYLKIFDDARAQFTAYSDAEVGRLFRAMMAYAFDGVDPDFDGVERYAWPFLKQNIDQCAEKVDEKKRIGSKGGSAKANASNAKQTVASDSKPKQRVANASNAKQTVASDSGTYIYDHEYEYDHDQDQEHEYDHDQEQEKKEYDARARVAAPATSAPSADVPVSVAPDHTFQPTPADLRPSASDDPQWAQDAVAQIPRLQRAEQLVRRYKLPDSDVSVEALLEDVNKHGEETVENALKAASLSNSQKMLSVNYYRAVLKGQLTGSHGRGDMMHHSPEERRRTFAAAIVDLDADDI